MSAPWVLCLAGLAAASAQSNSPGIPVLPGRFPEVAFIVDAMTHARAENRARMRPYSLTRRYRLLREGHGAVRAEVLVSIRFLPPDAPRFSILQSNGIRIGETVVRQMLEHETEIVRDFGSTDLSAANYDFAFLRDELLDGHRCFVLAMIPVRRDKTLIRGQVWVDAESYRLRRMEGAPGRPPSWWLRNSSIVLLYGDVEGMWLQTASESSADVRLIGRHTMLSRDLQYEISQPGTAVLPRHGAR